jgi:hypothetical protein
MGYEILIGEWQRDPPPESGAIRTPRAVAVIEHAHAPCFDGDGTGRTNRRVWRYQDWYRFVRVTGLWGLFHEDGGILGKHPGTVRVRPHHAVVVRQEFELFAAARPHARPTFVSRDPDDHHLAELKWLVWWMEWTLANCSVPAIHNR